MACREGAEGGGDGAREMEGGEKMELGGGWSEKAEMAKEDEREERVEGD